MLFQHPMHPTFAILANLLLLHVTFISCASSDLASSSFLAAAADTWRHEKEQGNDSTRLISSHRVEPFFPNQTVTSYLHHHQRQQEIQHPSLAAAGRSIRLYKQRPTLFRPSLFHVVKFPNDECLDASNQSGICYTPLECKALGGTASASCAKGYGSCCIISRTCHNITSQRVTYFRNPSYPQADSHQNYCDLAVEIKDPDVCQVRLDLLDFNLDQPTNGECLGDKLTVTASGLTMRGVPSLCGINRNQHLFVDVPRDATDRSVTILFQTNGFGTYRWHIRVTQIDCTRNPHQKRALLSRQQRSLSFFQPAQLKVSLPAPPGCLQYFDAPTGMVESFNFGEYLNNMDYAICIERHPSTCRLTIAATDYEWNIDKVTQPKTASGVGDQDCLSDYLMIPGASATGDGLTHDRFCGGVLNYRSGANNEQQVQSKANGPIVLRFHSDGTHDPTIKEGFRIRYEQSSTNCEVFSYSQFQDQQPIRAAALLQGLALHNKVQLLSPSQHEDVTRRSRARYNAKRWKNFN